MIETRSPLESLAAFAIAFVAGILSTIVVQRRVDSAVKKAMRPDASC